MSQNVLQRSDSDAIDMEMQPSPNPSILTPSTYNSRALSQQFQPPATQKSTRQNSESSYVQKQQQMLHEQHQHLLHTQHLSTQSMSPVKNLASQYPTQAFVSPVSNNNNFVNPRSRRRRSLVAPTGPRRNNGNTDIDTNLMSKSLVVNNEVAFSNSILKGDTHTSKTRAISPIPPSRFETIPPVPPIPDQVLSGRHRQGTKSSRQKLEATSNEARLSKHLGSNDIRPTGALNSPRKAPNDIGSHNDSQHNLRGISVDNTRDGITSNRGQRARMSLSKSMASFPEVEKYRNKNIQSVDESDYSLSLSSSIPGQFPATKGNKPSKNTIISTANNTLVHSRQSDQQLHQQYYHHPRVASGSRETSGARRAGNTSKILEPSATDGMNLSTVSQQTYQPRLLSKSHTFTELSTFANQNKSSSHQSSLYYQPTLASQTESYYVQGSTVSRDLELNVHSTNAGLKNKSPYRPLNRMLPIHPRADNDSHEDLSPASSQDNASSPARVRSKSTFSRQWPSPKNSHSTIAAATRRMLGSPLRKFGQNNSSNSKRNGHSANQASNSSVSIPRSSTETRYSSEISYSDDRLVCSPEEIRTIMRYLVTSKSNESISDEKVLHDMKKANSLVKEPLTAAQATKQYKLTLHEKGEILDFRRIYYCGRVDSKVVADLRRPAGNYGFDDDKGDYKAVIGDHIAYRYRVLAILGKGSFGKVLKCVDHKTGQLVAIKIIINRKRFHMQGLVEAGLLKSITAWNAKEKYHLIKYQDHFNFREHLCISTELLGINLYELLKYNEYKGLPLLLVKHFSKQILEALDFLASKNIIHCDLKPENILLSDIENGFVKIIDFGSSCYSSEKVYTYIQSRFYRSPEVMLGMSYNEQIDIWSVACIIPELLTGRPLFMGENEQEQVACIMQYFGLPDTSMLVQCARRKLFFDSSGNSRFVASKKGERHVQNSKSLEQTLKTNDKALIDFLTAMLRWNPKKRLTANDALKHEFITGQIPIRSASSASNSSNHPVLIRTSRAMSTASNNSYTPMNKASPRQLQRIKGL